MKKYFLPFLMSAGMALTPLSAHAQVKQLDVEKLPSKKVHDVADLTPVALQDGKPLVVLLHIAKGQTVPPHATQSNLRLISVLKGTLYWGDGNEYNRDVEKTYPQGSVLMLAANAPHWVAAYDNDVLLQLVVLPEDAPTNAVKEQIK